MRTDTRAPIRQLSSSIINKIAAGEVIERPASVVKELVENSVDAGALRVDISVEQGGGELIRVVDTGHGIPPAELLLAVTSHATSKIREVDDLFSVHTMGFRGEALASIAEVSHFCIRSREPDCDEGAELVVIGGRYEPPQPCGCSVGTTVEVRNLFFNTPVRRKFLRTAQTEMGHATEAFTRIALAYPQVHFTLRHNERTLFDLPPTTDLSDRIASFFGNELAVALIPVESCDGPVRISGYVANPAHSRSSNKHQYLFLNGRHIRDRALQHALTEAYRGLLLTGRFPIAFLYLEMPADTIDVNVHPTKLEVRFQDGGRLYSQLLGMLRSRFLTSDLTATAGGQNLRPYGATAAATGSATGFAASEPAAATSPDQARADQLRADVRRWAQGAARVDSPHDPVGRPNFSARDLPSSSLPIGAPAPVDSPDGRSDGRGAAGPRADQLPVVPQFATAVGPATQPSANPSAVVSSSAVVPSIGMQIHNRYLVTESEEGMVVIDQHALHERILYELLREKVTSQSVEKQRLLVPEPVQMAPTEAAAVLQAKELLSHLGIDVDDFGGGTVLVSSYPAMLANFSPGDLIRQLAEQLAAGTKTPEPRDLLDELLHMISCKAAIKAGDRLAPEEVQALIEQRHLVQDSHHCPHGRPTTLVFTRKELDHLFKRT
jgi:DNA mismatch repair protein MutL